MAAFLNGDYATAEQLWRRSKGIDPLDWHLRAKLVQVYQAMGKLTERDAERRELVEMWKAGKPAELKEQVEFCRDQFEVKDKKVMAFEHFELKGNRALRYVFSILTRSGDDEEFRISLGSYDLDQALWRERTKPTPKPDERLFHLDGYFKWGHATYGFFAPEPSYDDIKRTVVKILEGQDKPLSSTIVNQADTKPKP
jgi:hypothetical protein